MSVVVPMTPAGLPILSTEASVIYDASGQEAVLCDFGTYRRKILPRRLEQVVHSLNGRHATVYGDPLKLDGSPATTGPREFTFYPEDVAGGVRTGLSNPIAVPAWIASYL